MRTKVNIIFRTCDKVNALHGTDRPYGMTKEQIVNYCFISLKRSLAYSQNINDINHDVIIVGDELSQERIEWYKVYGPKVIYNDYFTNNYDTLHTILDKADYLEYANLVDLGCERIANDIKSCKYLLLSVSLNNR